MAAVRGLDEGDVGIGENLLPGFRKDADERIVGGIAESIAGTAIRSTTLAAAERA